jgi:hypothetical protein
MYVTAVTSRAKEPVVEIKAFKAPQKTAQRRVGIVIHKYCKCLQWMGRGTSTYSPRLSSSANSSTCRRWRRLRR